MRISDWSSDVCSSDLVAIPTTHCRKFVTPIKPANLRRHTGDALSQVRHPDQTCEPPSPYRRRTVASSAPRSNLRTSVAVSTTGFRRLGRLVRRSEERSVGKECGSKCGSRWSRYTKKNKKKRIK